MKIAHLLLVLLPFGFQACKDDDDASTTDDLLKYDGANNSGPLLDAGEHELAVRFPAATMAEYAGKKLTEVQVFVGAQPQSALVRVYGAGTATVPGALRYEANVTSALDLQEWNYFPVTPSLTLTGDDLWVSVHVTHAQQQQSIGCDAGPRNTDGDWLFSDSDADWKTYLDRTAESVNWNIRAKVE